MIRLGVLGCGNMGQFVIRSLARPELKPFVLQVLADVPEKEAQLRALAGRHHCDYTTDPLTLGTRPLDLELEAANPEAVKRYVPGFLGAGINVLAMSVGALADITVFRAAEAAAQAGGSRLLLPTGAIAGLDYIKAARLAGLEEARITVIKAPKSLVGAPYFEEHPVDLSALREPTTVFQGNATDAIRGFPANVNVAVALSLVSVGPAKTEVKIVCDPDATQTRYEIFTRGATGELTIRLVNLVSPDNPRTSYQACWSALATLQRFCDPVQMGS
jgi:aspartate dehydrogenase